MYVVDVIGSVSPDEPQPAPIKPSHASRWPAVIIATAIGLTVAIIVATPRARRR